MSMKRRCKHDPFYLSRGITVCERWANSFPAFLEDMGKKPSRKLQIDRWPNALGNYEPGNCRWATPKQQGWSKAGWESEETRRLKAAAMHEHLRNGTSRKQKLSVADIREIRRLEGIEKRPVIAARFGINLWHVRDIQKRRVWAWVE
jgi:DNA-binding transcriptional regulator YiaG